jgi:hypothetical protein
MAGNRGYQRAMRLLPFAAAMDSMPDLALSIRCKSVIGLEDEAVPVTGLILSSANRQLFAHIIGKDVSQVPYPRGSAAASKRSCNGQVVGKWTQSGIIIRQSGDQMRYQRANCVGRLIRFALLD